MTGNTRRAPLVGILTLLVIFAVLCLSIFAALSLKTARYNLSLAQRSAQAVTDYYAADSTCTQRSNQIYALWKQGGSDETLTALVAPWGGTGTRQDGVLVLTWSCKIDDSRVLKATVSAGTIYQVEQWSVNPAGDWTADETLPVWGREGEKQP